MRVPLDVVVVLDSSFGSAMNGRTILIFTNFIRKKLFVFDMFERRRRKQNELMNLSHNVLTKIQLLLTKRIDCSQSRRRCFVWTSVQETVDEKKQETFIVWLWWSLNNTILWINSLCVMCSVMWFLFYHISKREIEALKAFSRLSTISIEAQHFN